MRLPVLSSDRREFERHMAVLCAAYNIPATEERLEAFWRGLAKMELSTFARFVEHCLSEEGPEKFPSCRAVWPISRSLRARAQAPQAQRHAWSGDEWLAAGNRHLYAYILRAMLTARTFDAEETRCLVDAKNAWVEDMRVDRPDAARQKAAWEDVMRRAEQRIAALQRAAA